MFTIARVYSDHSILFYAIYLCSDEINNICFYSFVNMFNTFNIPSAISLRAAQKKKFSIRDLLQ